MLNAQNRECREAYVAYIWYGILLTYSNAATLSFFHTSKASYNSSN
jgi:hypothetical protein